MRTVGVLVLVLGLVSACATVDGPAPVLRPREVSLVGVDRVRC